MAKIDHAAIRTMHYDQAKHFFQHVFEMHIDKETGSLPERKCWFCEGIQLCEKERIQLDFENGYDHICIKVESIEEIMKRAAEYPIVKLSDNWFKIPDNVTIELK